MDRVVLIIPIYNCEKNLHSTFSQLEELSAKIGDGLMIILVDDGSSDNTPTILAEYTGSLKSIIQILTLPKNQGKGYAIREAVQKYAGESDYVCFTDADLPYSLSSILEVIKKGSEADIVVGSRALVHEQKQYSWYRYILNRIFRLCIPKEIRSIKDTQCGLKAFESRVAEDIFHSIQTFRWTFDLEIFLIAKRRGYQIKEVPVRVRKQSLMEHGGVSISKHAWQIGKDLWKIHRNKNIGVYEK